jgi:dihydroorotate dehydrogenase
MKTKSVKSAKKGGVVKKLKVKMAKMNRRYDINKTFEYNREKGPFEKIPDQNKKIAKILGNYGIEADFFGFKTKLPIGVAAGPLYNPRYMIGAARDGFTVITWKTFRTVDRLAHRNSGGYVGHNIVYISSEKINEGSTSKPIVGSTVYDGKPTELSITNSFGMPSKTPMEWMKEVHEMEKFMDDNHKLAITSVVGSPTDDGTIEDLARDYAFAARSAETAGAKIVELNLSCPNVCGKEGSIYKDPNNTRIITEIVRKNFVSKNTKLLIKIGYADSAYYVELLKACHMYIDGVVLINTIPMQITDPKGKQALPGGLKSGVCGSAIIDMAVQAVKNVLIARNTLKIPKTKLKVVGCGGVMNAENFMAHINAGAEYVMCATAALFNPELPVQVAEYIRDHKINKKI